MSNLDLDPVVNSKKKSVMFQIRSLLLYNLQQEQRKQDGKQIEWKTSKCNENAI